jgi:colanic acid/amylovoran biosynthesis glycosyltransferase
VSRFPKISETFVLYEILALEAQGFRVDLYPLLRSNERLVHREAIPLLARARFQPFISRAVIASNLRSLRRHPRRYLGALWSIVAGTVGSRNYLLGGLAIFPKAVHAADSMQRDGVAHVHCHFANHPALAGLVIKRLTGVPFSFTAHAFDIYVDRHMLRTKVAEAAFVTTISEYNRRLIVEHCGDQADAKVAVIHCGVDSEVFRPRKDERRAREFTIACVGTLEPKKGQPVLVEACAILRHQGIDVICNIVGEGPERAALERAIADAGLEGRVALLGARTRAEVAALLARSDVLVAPSVPLPNGKKEGIPIVLMEAMSCEMPVVASEISGIPELVEHERTGLLAPPGDAAALARALQRLHAEPGLRNRLGGAARRKVQREFDLSANAALLGRRFEAAAVAVRT